MTATAELIATVQDLQKRYGPLEAVRGLSFNLQPGEIFGLLGPNGAGKTTTVEIMEGLRAYDGGSVRVLGFDPWRQARALKERIGAALQNTILPDKIFPREAIAHYAGFYSHPAPVDGLLSRFGLAEKRNTPYDALSGGQKQRLALALALVNNPDLVFLDEPTAGLDAQVRRDMHDLIAGLRADGKTVLLTTHYIEEAERLCDRVAIIAEGGLRGLGSPDELRRTARLDARIVAQFRSAANAGDLMRLGAVTGVKLTASGAVLHTTDPATTLTALVRSLDARGNALVDIQVFRPSLEDLYLELTGGLETPGAEAAP